MGGTVDFIRENVCRGMNYCSLSLCMPVPKLYEIAEKNNIEIPSNIDWIDFRPAIAEVTNNFSDEIKLKYFVTYNVECKGVQWCAEQAGVTQDEIRDVARSCLIRLDPPEEIETPTLREQLEIRNKISIEEFILMNCENKTYEQMSKTTGISQNILQSKASDIGIKKRAKMKLPGDVWKLLLYTQRIRMVMFGMSDDIMKSDILSQIQKIERYIYSMGGSNVRT